MKVFLNIILIAFFLSSFTNKILAQDSLQGYKMNRNNIKIGTSAFIKYHLSYEHAFAKHISAGAMVSYSSTTFIGYTGTIFTRYYFSPFDKSGFFLEAKGSYAYFNPTTYSSYYRSSQEAPAIYSGAHEGHINYLYGGISGGYKVVFSKNLFFECLVGLHYGKLTFAKNDIYMVPIQDVYGAPIKEVFDMYGPGFPVHAMINFGYAF